MKQFLLSLLMFLSVTTILSGQKNVTGQLIHSEDKSSLPFSSISISKASNTLKIIKRVATDDDGKFSIQLSSGEYDFLFQYVGMDKLTKRIKIINNDIDLGKIELNPSANLMNEVNVTAQRQLVKVDIDKLTYNVKEDPEASTSTVLDLMRKVPLLTVDGEDNIKLKGSSSFKIHLNGKPSNMMSNNPSQVLKSMPASSIKDIEVITDPGAKYDAEGVTGIINIITDKRVDDGYSGSVGAKADTYGGYGGNLYLTTKYGKFGATGNASYSNHKRPESTTELIRETSTPSPINSLNQNSSSQSDGNGFFLNASLSYELDTLNLFNFSFSRFSGMFNSNSISNATSVGAKDYNYELNSNSINEFGGMNMGADYQRSFSKKGEYLTLSYRYQYDPNKSEFENYYKEVVGSYFYPRGYRMKSINDAGGVEHTGQIDYINPINFNHTIEAGIKYIRRDNSSRGEHNFRLNDSDNWKPDLGRKNDLDHIQNIASGYFSYNYKIGKFGLKPGLRGEYTNQKISYMNKIDTVVNSDFFDLVPSIMLSYQLGMTKTIRGGYSLRIARPGISYLNPYVNEVDPVNIRYGNPDLEAEHSHNFNISYSSFARKFNFNSTLGYSLTNNAITSYNFIENGVNHSTYGNIGKNHSLSLNLYSAWTPNQHFNIYVNANVNYTKIKSINDSKLENSGFSGMTFAGATYNFGYEIRLSANGGFFSRPVQLQTEFSPFYFYNFTLMKSFFNKKLDISISTKNPFQEFMVIEGTNRGEGYFQEMKNFHPARNVRFSVNYRFGELKSSIKKVKRTIKNDDLKSEDSQDNNGISEDGGGMKM